MNRPRRPPLAGALAAVLLILLATTAAAEVMPLDGIHGLSTVERHRLHSEVLGTTYTILVRLPESLADVEEGAEPAKLPVVYLLDGGVTFPALAAYYRYLRLGEELPELIVVGISYGTDDWRQGNQRGRDFTAPSDERDHWGGVAPFLDFLEAEVFPLVESRHPADPARRVLFGQSLGGQAAIWAALHRPGLFWGHVASNPALHRNLDLFLQAPTAAAEEGEPPPRPLLFVSSGSDDDPRFRAPALRWIEHWQGREHPWVLETRTLEGHGHFSALPAAFRDGLRWLFAQTEGGGGEPAPAAAEPAAAFDLTTFDPMTYFLGEWDLTHVDAEGRIVGKSRTHAFPTLDGTYLQVDFRGLDRAGEVAFRGTTLRTALPEPGRWVVHWAMAGREGFTYIDEEWKDGALHGTGRGFDGEGELIERYRYFDLTADGYAFQLERSRDGGETWVPGARTEAVRRGR